MPAFPGKTIDELLEMARKYARDAGQGVGVHYNERNLRYVFIEMDLRLSSGDERPYRWGGMRHDGVDSQERPDA